MTLPTFLLIGAMKAGTTSVWRYLDQHPDVFMSPLKEPTFFAFPPGPLRFEGPGDDVRMAARTDSLPVYEALFDESAGQRAIGEASTAYLYCPGTAERIKAELPDARLIAVLRQPADRAYSNFTQMRRLRDEPLVGFDAALAAESARRRAGWDPIWCYRDRGFYAAQLKRYLNVFGRSQLHVTLYDDLKADPRAFMQSLYRFIGVDPGFVPDMSFQHNVGGEPRSAWVDALLGGRSRLRRALRPALRVVLRRRGQRAALRGLLTRLNRGRRTLDPARRRSLTATYADDIEALGELIGRDLSHWLEPPAQQHD